MARDHQDLVRDQKNHYLHIIVAPGKDNCSECKLQDLLELNTMLKFCVKYFQTAIIQYNCKSDTELRENLFKIVLSCQRGLKAEKQKNDDDDGVSSSSSESDEELDLTDSPVGESSVFKVSSTRNIARKIGEVIEWFASGSSVLTDRTSVGNNTTYMSETM